MRDKETNEEIIEFIKKFTLNGKRREVIECFKNGCCYWFAFILYNRFSGKIVYDEIMNHFAFKSESTGFCYDIEGKIKDKADWIDWMGYYKRDKLNFQRIVDQCIEYKE